VDSLYSIVQMPSGVPVATVGVDGAKNAGILAVQILAQSDPDLKVKLHQFKKEMAAEVEKKGEKLKQIGYRDYLGQPGK
jgi:5-(carboxyamino)imidazole ribonucleotide mutase